MSGSATWKRFDRTALFPKTPGNGSTSDHLVHYVPSIDRFVWFMEHLAGSDGSRQPSANELAIARFQGRHVAQLAAKLAAR